MLKLRYPVRTSEADHLHAAFYRVSFSGKSCVVGFAIRLVLARHDFIRSGSGPEIIRCNADHQPDNAASGEGEEEGLGHRPCASSQSAMDSRD